MAGKRARPVHRPTQTSRSWSSPREWRIDSRWTAKEYRNPDPDPDDERQRRALIVGIGALVVVSALLLGVVLVTSRLHHADAKHSTAPAASPRPLHDATSTAMSTDQAGGVPDDGPSPALSERGSITVATSSPVTADRTPSRSAAGTRAGDDDSPSGPPAHVCLPNDAPCGPRGPVADRVTSGAGTATGGPRPGGDPRDY